VESSFFNLKLYCNGSKTVCFRVVESLS